MNQDVLNQKVYAEQVKLLYASMPAAVIANIVVSILFIALQWQVIEKVVLFSWLAVSIIIIVVRIILLFFYKHRPQPSNNTSKWGKLFLLGSSASGLILGTAGILLFPVNDPIYQLVCTFVLLGMCAGALSSLSFGKYNFLIYAIVALVPLLLSLSLENTRLTLALIPMILMYFFFLLKSSATIYKNTQQNILLRLQATEREKELLKSQQRHLLHTQETPLGVIEWDTDFRVTDWNASAEKIFGYSKEGALGQHPNALLIPDTGKSEANKIWQQLLTAQGGTHFEISAMTKDKSIITSEWFNTALVNNEGHVIGVTSLIQDISERKRIEKMKSEFVSTVSHELRTPLTAIRGSLELLLAGVAGPFPEDASKMLQMANYNTDRLLKIINDILDMKKIETGDFDFSLTDTLIMPEIEEAIKANETYASQFDVKYIIGQYLEDKKILIDKLRFSQVMNNLLSNAAKFSPKGEKVEINVTQNSDVARIEISDAGKGIPKVFQEKIFDRFTQSDSSNTRSTGGTGLGLAITKVIIEKFNGEIGFNSIEGKGTTFYIELPLVTEQQKKAQ